MKILKINFLVLLLVIFSTSLKSQISNDEILMTIAGKQIKVNEFMNIYKKNNVKGETIDRKSLTEYVDLFVNFKLKVKEAEESGLDTVASFRNELNGYRDQLAKPYFTDEATLEALINEAAEREKTDIRASHIFFRLKPDAAPEDTLAVYQKALKIRELAIKGESFEKLAVEYSEDPSANDREANQQHPFLKGNKGDLGYFTVFDMVYPFENGAYNTPTGGISMPVRSEYGFHLIKVYQKRPSLGDFVVAHIFMAIPRNATTADSARIKNRIDSVYAKLQSGTKFDELAKSCSDDKGSATKGGVLPRRGVNRLVPEFIDAVYALNEPGDYSQPVLTSYGWHIIMLVEKKNVKTPEELKAELKQKVMKDSRGETTRQVVIARIKQENGFKENLQALADFYTVVNDSIFAAKWKKEWASNLQGTLLSIGNVRYNQQDFASWLEKTQRKRETENIHNYVDKQYRLWADDCLIKFEDNQLEDKYPDFKSLLSEYRDGILLFDLTDQKVWSKAVKDTTGLKTYYQKNKKNYMWDTRLNASIYTVKDPGLTEKVKAMILSGSADADILKTMNNDSLQVVTIESGKFSRNENKIIDSIPWTPGLSGNLQIDGATVFVYVRKKLKPEPKELNEARGLITADYQNFLEKEWIASLRAKYPVVINKEVLEKIK
ncbi:MAG TPA: peptidylprolyl isomerase [Bacteroidales bacterium]|nr:peptidylprolyl isomerase [Bacteroidales bacterium]HPT09701.1 peptidylprolyl isomerase [Bacteroidales bacterium]